MGLIVDSETNEAVPLLEAMTRGVNRRCASLRKKLGEAHAEAVGIGTELIAIRKHIQDNKVPGGFDGWIANEFDWSRSQAYRLIEIATVFGDCPNLGHYDQSAMYQLAAPGTPQEARDEARQLADAGKYVDYTTASDLINKVKGDGGVSRPSRPKPMKPNGSVVRNKSQSKPKAVKQTPHRHTLDGHALEVAISTPKADSYQIEFGNLVTGSNARNAVVITGLTKKHLELIRDRISGVLVRAPVPKVKFKDIPLGRYFGDE